MPIFVPRAPSRERADRVWPRRADSFEGLFWTEGGSKVLVGSPVCFCFMLWKVEGGGTAGLALRLLPLPVPSLLRCETGCQTGCHASWNMVGAQSWACSWRWSSKKEEAAPCLVSEAGSPVIQGEIMCNFSSTKENSNRGTVRGVWGHFQPF